MKKILALSFLLMFSLQADAGYDDPQVFYPDSSESGLYFGGCLTFDDDHLVFGSHAAGPDAGSVSIYDKVNGQWTHNHSLAPAPAGSRFGYSVALEGDTLVSGAYTYGNAGGVYVFRRDGNNVWQQVQLIEEASLPANSAFGYAVRLQGDTLLVTARYANTFTGSLWIYTLQDDGTYALTQSIIAHDAEANDNFGRSIDIEGDLIAVGSYRDTNANGTYAGSVYLYRLDGTGLWQFEAKLLASDGAAVDQFGYETEIDGGRVAVGANEHDNPGGSVGKLYIYEKDDTGAWTETHGIVGPDGPQIDNFTNALDFVGNRIAVGDLYCDVAAYNAGAVYIYDYVDGQWLMTERLIGAGIGYDDQFGWGVGLSADALVITAPGVDGQASNNGQVFAYTLPPVPEFASASGEVLGHKKNAVVRADSSLVEGTSANGLIFVLERHVNGIWTFVSQETGFGDTPPQVIDMNAGAYKPGLFEYRLRLLDAGGSELDVSNPFKTKVVADLSGDGKVTKEDYKLYLKNPFDFDLDGDLDEKDKEAFISWIRREWKPDDVLYTSLP